jgi:hypothetical protein
MRGAAHAKCIERTQRRSSAAKNFTTFENVIASAHRGATAKETTTSARKTKKSTHTKKKKPQGGCREKKKAGGTLGLQERSVFKHGANYC